MNPTREARIEALLVERFHPTELRIKDQSHLHAGHEGAKDGRGHFDLYLVAADFEGLPPVQRHQLVYSTLADMLRTDIHALRIRALAPDEARLSADK